MIQPPRWGYGPRVVDSLVKPNIWTCDASSTRSLVVRRTKTRSLPSKSTTTHIRKWSNARNTLQWIPFSRRHSSACQPSCWHISSCSHKTTTPTSPLFSRQSTNRLERLRSRRRTYGRRLLSRLLGGYPEPTSFWLYQGRRSSMSQSHTMNSWRSRQRYGRTPFFLYSTHKGTA